MKPLYAVPLNEIESLNYKELVNKKLFSIELVLKKNYGLIASTISQLMTATTAHL